MANVICDCGVREGRFIYHALWCNVMKPKAKRNQCLYCPDNDCGTKPCYIEVMNKSGKEYTKSKLGLIIPLKDAKRCTCMQQGKLFHAYWCPLYFKPSLSQLHWFDTFFETARSKKVSLDIESTWSHAADAMRYFYKDPFTITKEHKDKKDKMKMNIYSFPLTRCSKNIWCGRDGKQVRVSEMVTPYLKNVYAKLLRSAWQHCENQDTINKISIYSYPGRYEFHTDPNIARMNRSLAFLREFCPTWDRIAAEMYARNLALSDGTPISYSVSYDRQLSIYYDKRKYTSFCGMDWSVSETAKFSGGSAGAGKTERSKNVEAVIADKIKLTNGKLFTDTDGRQYLLFPIE